MPQLPERRRSGRPTLPRPGQIEREPTLDAACRAAAHVLGGGGAVAVVELGDGAGFFGAHGIDEDGEGLDPDRVRAVLDDATSLAEGGDGTHLRLPLRAPDGRVAGALCVLDVAAGRDRDVDRALLDDLGELVEGMVHAREATRELIAHVVRRRTELETLVHDIRQPLSTVSGAAQLLEFEAQDDDMPLASLVTDGVDRVEALLEEIVRPGADGPALVPLEEAVPRACASAAPPEDARLRVDVAPGSTVVGFTEDVQRIVANLVRNAFVHGGPGVEVVVRAWRGLDGAIIEVGDDGPGIAPDRVEAVFAFGGRLDESVPGQGIGLHVVRTLARRTGGDVEVHPTPGGGATFRVLLRDVSDPDAATVDVTDDVADVG